MALYTCVAHAPAILQNYWHITMLSGELFPSQTGKAGGMHNEGDVVELVGVAIILYSLAIGLIWHCSRDILQQDKLKLGCGMIVNIAFILMALFMILAVTLGLIARTIS